jgi:hypothetical protein
VSATGRGAVRQPDDLYETPAWAIDAILPHLPISGPVLDPGCGRGAIIGRLLAAGVRRADVVGVELDAGRARECRETHRVEVVHGDFLDYRQTCFGLAIGNPPFSLLSHFAERCLGMTAHVRGTTALLARLNWLAPAKRGAFLEAHKPDVYALERRPAFIASGHCTRPEPGQKKPSKRGCGWSVQQPIDEPRAKACPDCGGSVAWSTSDAAEYAFLVWGPGRGGHFYRLPPVPRGAGHFYRLPPVPRGATP